MPHFTREDILRKVKEDKVEFIRLQFTDIFGMLKNITIMPSQLEKALDNKCMFDGSSIDGFVRIEESDMYLYPDYDTYEVYDLDCDNAARLICDVYRPNKEPFEGDCRYILKKVIQEAAEMGYRVNVGPECEFFLFEQGENGEPTLNTNDKGGYFDMSPVALGGNIRREICIALQNMNFEIETSHHECAPAQHEVDFKYTDALNAADQIQTFKMVVKSIAMNCGMYATFMPKPKFGWAGSGMHANISLYDLEKKKNAFADDNDENGLSELAYSFIAGVMAHIKEMTAVTNPLVNSYKRLVPDFEAPVYIAWSKKNRSPLIRVPSARGSSTRIELRSPDPSCNPYLALAVVIASGLDGIKKGMKAPKSVDVNIFDLTKEERAKKKIDSLPVTLLEAIEAMENSKFVRSVLGEHIFTKYLISKRGEWMDYTCRVTPWEIDEYFGKY